MTKHSNLAAALSALQGEMPAVPKSKTVNTGKYAYKYADLASVMEAIAPHLKANGLAFTALPVTDDKGFRLEGVLMHESGDQLTGSLPLNGRTPQEIGSALTYARRYLLGCLTGVVTDEDDDGQRAQRAASATGQGNRLAERMPAAQARPVETKPATATQRKKIMAQFGEVERLRGAEVTRENRLTAYQQWTGQAVTSTNDLTTEQAGQVITMLDGWIDRLMAAEQAQGELEVQA